MCTRGRRTRRCSPLPEELGVSKLRMPPEEVVSFLERLAGPVRAVY
jgi:hypothetical protein